jgi:hypothetical protein
VPPLKLRPSEFSPSRQPSPSRGTSPHAVSTASGVHTDEKSLDHGNGEVVIIRFLSWACAFRSFRLMPVFPLLPASSPRTVRCPSESCFLTNLATLSPSGVPLCASSSLWGIPASSDPHQSCD